MSTTERTRLKKHLIVRNLRFDKGMPKVLVCYKIHMSSGLVYKYSKKPDVLSTTIPQKISKSKLAPFVDIIDEWIIEQNKLPPRKREYSSRYRVRFMEENHIYTNLTNFRTFVRERKLALSGSRVHSITQNLIHFPYECQMDLGTITYYDHEQNLKFGFIVAVAFPNSAMSYCQIVSQRNTEAIVESLVNIFEHIGSAPKEMWCDNEASIVIFPKKSTEPKKLIHLFNEFVKHYDISVRFLGLGRSCGKGSVEKKIDYLRKNLLVPVPFIPVISDYNKELLSRCEMIHDRLNPRSGKHILSAFKEDTLSWTKIVKPPLLSQTILRLKVDNLSRVFVRNKAYYLDPKYNEESVFIYLKSTTCTIKLCSDNTTILSVPRLTGVDLQENVNWSKFFPNLARHPMSVSSHPIMKLFPKTLQYYIIIHPVQEVSSLLHNMAIIYNKSSLETAIFVANKCVENNTVSLSDFITVFRSIK